MRRLIAFTCQGEGLGASLDEASGTTAILIVTGGSQTRIGSHRMFERLGAELAAAGYPALRFDRRGVGDSGGEDPGFRGSGPDLEAAAALLRAELPHVQRVIGFGLCDGATALALHGAAAGLDAMIFVNPWLVESEAGAPPAAAVKQHYRRRLASSAFWKQFLSGGVSYRKALAGLLRIAKPPPATLEAEVAAALERKPLPTRLILAERDATAIAAREVWASDRYRRVRGRSGDTLLIDSDSHTFAKSGDDRALLRATLQALSGL